tara:strand:+ start:390 stop:707 length:318 start_codon:yes stop_codon:yes gene_type:complete
MTATKHAVLQETVSATVTSGDAGTGWLALREGGRYFDMSIAGDWEGRVTLELRACPGRPGSTVMALAVFVKNAEELFHVDRDSDVRLWVRNGDFGRGRIRLELGT